MECRAVLCNFEQVKDKLIFCVSGLAMKTLKYVKGRHLKKTSTFVKACLAYCHITIPSLSSVFRKLQLLLYCAEVSLANQCLPQTDTFLKAAISLIPEMPTFYDEIDGKKHIHYEEKLSDYILSLLSFLVVAPGHPEHGPFYIIQGLLNAIPSFQWQIVTGIQIKIYINILNLLTTLAQRKFPYHIYGVESNNELYGGAEAYLTELNDFINICITEILKLLTQLGERQEVSSKLNQVKITIIFINEISNGLELTKTTAEFLFKLIELVYKNKNIFTRNDQKLFEYTIQFATQQAKLSSFDGANVFINALKKYTLQ